MLFSFLAPHLFSKITNKTPPIKKDPHYQPGQYFDYTMPLKQEESEVTKQT